MDAWGDLDSFASQRQTPDQVNRLWPQRSNVPGHGAIAAVKGRRVIIAKTRLIEREQIDLGDMADRRAEIAAGGRTAVLAAVDGTPVAAIGIADAACESDATGTCPLSARNAFRHPSEQDPSSSLPSTRNAPSLTVIPQIGSVSVFILGAFLVMVPVRSVDAR